MKTRRIVQASLSLALALFALPTRGQTANVEKIVAKSGFRGGLVVLIGNELKLGPALGKIPNALVHGLVADAKSLASARKAIRAAGLYGRVSAMGWQGPRLPYGDGMVNLLVVDQGIELAQQEVERVLAPRGMASWSGDGKPDYRKPVQKDTDEWSHARYNATGNAVSVDKRVGPPRHLQWEALPRWNHGTKTSCLVSANGRIFFILDDAAFGTSARTWSLIARDANNGIRLWRRELDGWQGARGGKKTGPAQVNRRLVAIGDRVYATLGEEYPVSVLDAATGKVLRVLKQTKGVDEFVVSNGVLLAMIDPNTGTDSRRGVAKPMRIVAMDPKTGNQLWEHVDKMIMPLTTATDGELVVYHDGKAVRGLDLLSGSSLWTSPPTGQKIAYHASANADRPGAEKGVIWLAPQFAPTMVMYGDVVAFAGGRQLNVVAKKDGKELWRTDYAPSNYSVPVDLFGFKGMLWGPDIAMNLWRPMDDDLGYHAFDPLTGKAKTSAKGKYNFRFQHHRCHQMRVVDNTILGGRAGVEFLDTETSKVAAHHWLRGSCYYGVMPANGLLYVPPHNCACYIRAKLSGFMALRPSPGLGRTKIPEDQRLQRGPAYGQTKPAASEPNPADWPTYRHDAARSGRVDATIKTDLLLGWRTQLGGKLTSPVIADGRVYVVSSEAHRLQALDARTGKALWQYSFDARVDSPPTVHEGLVLTGCRDGSVHAIGASDGRLVWRFRAAPAERMIVSRGQLESVWPVHGSVLVLKDTVYFTAGKSSYLDGGIRLYGLEPHTGRKIVDTVLSTLSPEGNELLDEQGVKGYLSDILSSDGERLFMRHNILDLAGKPQPGPVTHLHGPDGFLSSDTASRIVWTYAPAYTSPHQGAFYDLRLSRSLFPSGKLLVEGKDTIYGFGQNRPGENRAQNGGIWGLFSCPKKNEVPLNLTAREYLKLGKSGKQSLKFNWSKRLPIHVLAMVKTKDVLFVAGPQGGGTISTAAARGKTGAALFAVSPADGEVLAEMSLPAAPAWDGMAVANGNLYLTLLNGDVVCLWSAASGRPGKKLDRTAWMPKLPPLQLAEEPGLIGRWRLDEGVGPVARDCSGNGHFAEVGGQWAEGTFGTCVVARGPLAVVIPDRKHLQFGMDSFSLALWVRIERHDIRILGKEAFPQNWWTINVFPSGEAELVLGEGRGKGMSARAKTKAPIATDAWTHLVFTVDRKAKLVSWYLNGRLDNTYPIPETMTKGLNADGADLAIPSSHKPFRGLIGDLRIYRKTLDGRKVQALHQEAAARYASTEFKIKE